MFQATLDRSRRLLSIQFSGRVDAPEMNALLERVQGLLREEEPGLRVLTDLSGLESMDPACAPFVGSMMEFLTEKGIAAVLRVVPNPQKDIGFALMSRFH